MATVLVGRLEQDPDDALAGRTRLRWASAGHLPPVLAGPDGERRVAARPAARPAAGRRPRDRPAARARSGCEQGLDAAALHRRPRRAPRPGLRRRRGSGWWPHSAELRGLTGREMCDALLTALVPGRADDDVALVAVRLAPRGRSAAAAVDGAPGRRGLDRRSGQRSPGGSNTTLSPSSCAPPWAGSGPSSSAARTAAIDSSGVPTGPPTAPDGSASSSRCSSGASSREPRCSAGLPRRTPTPWRCRQAVSDGVGRAVSVGVVAGAHRCLLRRAALSAGSWARAAARSAARGRSRTGAAAAGCGPSRPRPPAASSGATGCPTAPSSGCPWPPG